MSTKLNPKNGLFRICVDQKEDGRLSGRIVSQRLTAPMAFADLGDLLLKVEGVLDAQNFPQASQRIRTFVQDASEYPASVLPGGAMSEAEVEASRGALTTFQLAILTRRNATWQGAGTTGKTELLPHHQGRVSGPSRAGREPALRHVMK